MYSPTLEGFLSASNFRIIDLSYYNSRLVLDTKQILSMKTGFNWLKIDEEHFYDLNCYCLLYDGVSLFRDIVMKN